MSCSRHSSAFRLILFIIFLAISGCANNNINRIGKPEEMFAKGTGYVLGSVISRNYEPEVKLGMKAVVSGNFFSLENPTKSAFSIWGNSDGNPLDNIPDGNSFRRIVLLAVPPGKYKLGKIEATIIVPNKSLVRDMIDSPEIEVKEGQITYVGGIKFTTFVGKGWLFGQPVATSGSMTVTDDYEFDLAAMRRLEKRAANFAVSNGIYGAYPKPH